MFLIHVRRLMSLKMLVDLPLLFFFQVELKSEVKSTSHLYVKVVRLINILTCQFQRNSFQIPTEVKNPTSRLQVSSQASGLGWLSSFATPLPLPPTVMPGLDCPRHGNPDDWHYLATFSYSYVLAFTALPSVRLPAMQHSPPNPPLEDNLFLSTGTPENPPRLIYPFPGGDPR